MNEVEQFQQLILDAIPRAVIDYGPPSRPTGNHIVDVRVDGHRYFVLWRTDSGFWIGYNDPDDPDVGLFDLVMPGDVNVKTVDEAVKVLLELIAQPRPAAAAAAR
jgi:hypothetical protein